MPLRPSQVETLRLAERFDGTLAVWRLAEELHSDNWAAVERLEELARTRHLKETPLSALQGTRMASTTYRLTQLGHEALEEAKAAEIRERCSDRSKRRSEALEGKQ